MKFHPNLCEAVARALEDIFFGRKYADRVIDLVLKKNPKWGARDRKFIAETTYDMVRWWRLLHETAELPFSSHFSRSNFWQLFGAWLILNNLPIPSWEQLRNISIEKVLERYKEALKIRKVRESIPDWLDESGLAELGEVSWGKELHAMNEEAKVVLRVNTLKSSLEELRNMFASINIETEDCTLSPDCLVLKKRQNIFTIPAFKAGWFELQDAASQQVAPYLSVEPGMRVIDACAGAGGKTLHLSALMKNKGKIISMDTEQWKLDELKRRARRAGVSNVEIRLIDSNKTIKRLEKSADRLLLDVPCSGIGVLKRNPDAKWKLNPEFIERMKKLQEEILQDYSSLLKPGGLMVYSTCSIFPSENERRVADFLMKDKGTFEKIDEKKYLPSEGFDGFYMAKLRRLS